jgi:2-aminoethylphosphonate-pyruvate transaminase
MSAFGALPLDARETSFDAVAASANKCLEGVPGVGFVICRRAALEAAAGNAPSLSLDLHDQWTAMDRTGQWRFTPPVQVILAFAQALKEHEEEGGIFGRGARYRRNCRLLVEGMRALGFETLLPDRLQAPIIVTFRMPADPNFRFDAFYERLRDKGYVIYPGKLTAAESFRIGCIGRLGEAEMRGVLAAIEATMREMGVAGGATAPMKRTA